MMYRSLACIVAAIGLVHEAAAAEIDTAYLRGSDSYQVQQGAMLVIIDLLTLRFGYRGDRCGA